MFTQINSSVLKNYVCTLRHQHEGQLELPVLARWHTMVHTVCVQLWSCSDTPWKL